MIDKGAHFLYTFKQLRETKATGKKQNNSN
jgi:hypothetical protein